jgi:hypothetical protein
VCDSAHEAMAIIKMQFWKCPNFITFI